MGVQNNRSQVDGNSYQSNGGLAKTIVGSNWNSNSVRQGIPSIPEQAKTSYNSKFSRRMPNKEMEEKRLKGLCFRCNENFFPGHKCNKKQMYMITLEIDDYEEIEVVEELQNEKRTLFDPQLSIHALTCMDSCQTMRIRGCYVTKMLFLLIDLGSSHNFLDKGMTKSLGCTLEPIPAVKVAVANGNEIIYTKVCKAFQWKMQGNLFSADFLILPLENYDMVLVI